MYFGVHVTEIFGELESLSKFLVEADTIEEAHARAVEVLREWRGEPEEVQPGYFEYMGAECAAKVWTVEPVTSFEDAVRFVGVLTPTA